MMLNESKETINDIDYWKNPSRQFIEVLVDRSDHRELRALLDPRTNDVWMWDASSKLHDEAIRELGFSSIIKARDYEQYTFQIARVTDGKIYLKMNIKMINFVCKLPYFKRISDIKCGETPVSLKENLSIVDEMRLLIQMVS